MHQETRCNGGPIIMILPQLYCHIHHHTYTCHSSSYHHRSFYRVLYIPQNSGITWYPCIFAINSIVSMPLFSKLSSISTVTRNMVDMEDEKLRGSCECSTRYVIVSKRTSFTMHYMENMVTDPYKMK